MTKLTDMQLVLLTTAPGRSDGSLLPPAESLGTRADRIRRSVRGLTTKDFAAEIPVVDKSRTWRVDGEQLFGFPITDAGRAAIGVEAQPQQHAAAASSDEGGEPVAAAAVATSEPPAPSASPRRDGKIVGVLSRLRRPDGATLNELVDATGWLPHTTRAALTSLRKKGHAITKCRRGDLTCYDIQAAA